MPAACISIVLCIVLPPLLARVLDTEHAQFGFGQTQTAQHQTVAAQRLDRVDANAAHDLLQLVIPCRDQVDKSACGLVGV